MAAKPEKRLFQRLAPGVFFPSEEETYQQIEEDQGNKLQRLIPRKTGRRGKESRRDPEDRPLRPLRAGDARNVGRRRQGRSLLLCGRPARQAEQPLDHRIQRDEQSVLHSR